MGITVIGAVFIDIKGFPYTQYIPGGRNVGNVIQVHGGVSRNIAEDIGNIQLQPNFLSVVDESGLSRDVLNRLETHGVNTSYIRTSQDGLGTWLAVFDNQGDVTASISKRPDLSLILDVLKEQGDEIFRITDSVALEIDLEEEILNEVFALADRYDRKVYAAVSNISPWSEENTLSGLVVLSVTCRKRECYSLPNWSPYPFRILRRYCLKKFIMREFQIWL